MLEVKLFLENFSAFIKVGNVENTKYQSYNLFDSQKKIIQ